MATDKIKSQFQKNSEKPSPKKKNMFGPITRAKLKMQVAVHVNWLKLKYASDLVAMYLKTTDLKATNAKRIDLEAVIYVSVASIVAHAAHEGQLLKKDKKPYINHPKHIASKFDDPHEKQIALLHDVLENSNLTAEFLLELGFPEHVVADVALLTHDKNTPYLDYIHKVGKGALFHTLHRIKGDDAVFKRRMKRTGEIKSEDLDHNMDPRRTIPGIRKEYDMYKRGEGYDIALVYLKAIKNGKIEPGCSVVEFLTSYPDDYLLAERDDMKSLPLDKRVQYRAEQLYVARKALMYLSTEYGAIERLWDPTIKKLVGQNRLPPPQSPVLTAPDMMLSHA